MTSDGQIAEAQKNQKNTVFNVFLQKEKCQNRSEQTSVPKQTPSADSFANLALGGHAPL